MEEQTNPEASTIKIVAIIGGADLPAWFMQEFTRTLGLFMEGAAERYKQATGLELQFLGPTARDAARVMGKDPAEIEHLFPKDPKPGIMSIYDDGADDDTEEVSPAVFDHYVQKLMDITGIDRERAEAACKSKEMPDDIQKLIVAAMAERCNLTLEEAAEVLENGPRLDAYGATVNCQCEGCRARRAAVQEEIEARRAARFN